MEDKQKVLMQLMELKSIADEKQYFEAAKLISLQISKIKVDETYGIELSELEKNYILAGDWLRAVKNLRGRYQQATNEVLDLPTAKNIVFAFRDSVKVLESI